MVKKLKLKSGKELDVDSVAKGRQYDQLQINLHTLTYPKAASLFSKKTETETLIYSENEEEYTYSGYTNLVGIMNSPFYSTPGELLIRLEKP